VSGQKESTLHAPKRLFHLLLLVFISVGLRAQVAAPSHILLPAEPAPNLGKLKLHLVAYHDCKEGQGCYETDLNHQSDLAIAYLQRRVAKAKAGEKLALVLDIDETSLSNWAVERKDDFGYIAKDWIDWENSEKAPAIAGTLRLFEAARKHGVSVFFITGRDTSLLSVTADNLKSAGYHDWAGLALRSPHPASQSVTEYKSGERQKIVDAGYKIILNVGDQISDLNGPAQAEQSVKLPNPFYYIP
jgi:acid phosphatase